MSNIIVDGMATYGTGTNDTRVKNAMLAGAYASIDQDLDVRQGLPWDPTETSYWLHAFFGLVSNHGATVRRVLPNGAVADVFASFQAAVASLPPANGEIGTIEFRNLANQAIASLYIQSTGVVMVDTGTEQRSSSSPVILAEKVHHWECELDPAAGKFILKIDENTVINVASGLTFTHADSIGQFALFVYSAGTNVSFDPFMYLSHLIIRDTNGDFNKDFVGNRFVATLFPSGDDLAHQGWEPQPLKRFGAGILDTTDEQDVTPSRRAGVAVPNTSITDIGASDFCLEGQFRLQALPTGSHTAVLAGKWDENINARSYQLYLGGPTLNNGNLIFRTSTDGQNGTTVTKLEWPWKPNIGQWYDIAVDRSSGVLRLFIDGVQAGIDVADSDTYFAGTAAFGIGASIFNPGNPDTVADTGWPGWSDELRLTIGTGRHTSNYTPPTDDYPRNIMGDPLWLSVALLTGWNNAAIADDSSHGQILKGLNGARTLTPTDGDGAYQTIREHTPSDDNFIEAALIPAEGIFTLTAANAANTETVTLGTIEGTTPAVYTFKTALSTAFDVLVGVDTQHSIANLINAINRGPGEGTTYGTGTTANFDVSAEALPVLSQLQVVALVPGAAGNAIVSTETCAHGSWGGATLAGGQDIPSYSQFFFDRLPPGATIVDSVTLVGRQYKTDSGQAKTKTSMVGVDGGVLAGTEVVLGTAPNLSFDLFETDPDSPGDPLTPNVVRNMRSKINRTV